MTNENLTDDALNIANLTRDKAAAFDWFSENKEDITIVNDSDGGVIIHIWGEGEKGANYEGKDLLEAVQNAIIGDGLNEMATIGQEIDNNGECK